MTYHQLGVIAQEQRDFVAAEAWYRKSLAIKRNKATSTAPPAPITAWE